MRNRTDVFLANASDGVIQYDEAGCIQYGNSKALNILGYAESQLLATNIFDLICTSDKKSTGADTLKQKMRHSMLQERPYESKRVHLSTDTQGTVVAEIKCNPVFNARGEMDSHLILFQDITSRTLNEQRLIQLSKYDVLTGLCNRSKFHSFTEGKIAYCTHNKKSMALLFIDIDHFKNINDSMGHGAGDELLVEVAKRLLACVRESDLVARIGGDEFAITLLDMGNPTQVTHIVNNIVEVMARPFLVQSREVNVSASVGISLFPENGSDLSTLTKTADTAMYQAKIDGRNTYRFFSSEIQNRVMEQNSLEIALRKAISNDEFSMHYQPQVDTVSGRIVGLEALIRWQHPDWPNIGPDRFIPVAEECGLLPAIGKWVLYSACRQAVKWREDKEINFDYPVAVNLSPSN